MPVPVKKTPMLADRLNQWLDHILAQPWVYAIFAFLAIRPSQLLDLDEQLFGALPIFRCIIYVGFTLALLSYAVRWCTSAIQRKNPTFLCILLLFLWLDAVTLLYQGASGYHIYWHSGFMLMMLLDMGLQRERESTLCGITLALEGWIYLNLLSLFAFPGGMITVDPLSPEWILGSRAIYYRIVFPAVALLLIRQHVLGKKWRVRTAISLAACVLTVALQRGGTGLIGFALLLALMLFCYKRALPRYLTPLTFTLIALLVFLGIHFFRLHYAFEWLISSVLHKSMTLSNRTDIWEQAMTLIFKNPVTGVGLLPVAYISPLLGGYAHTHNQLLELMLHGGFVALGLYFAALYFVSREAIAHRRSAAVKTAALLLIAFAFMGVSEMFHNEPLYYALFVLLSRADALALDAKPLPRISLKKRLARDLKK